MLGEFLSVLLSVSTVVNILFAVFIVFFERKNPAVTWAWLMVITLLPWGGFFLYLCFGFEGRKHKIFALKSKQDEEIFNRYYSLDIASIENIAVIHKKQSTIEKSAIHYLSDMILLNASSSNSAFTKGNNITLFHEGNSKFESLIDDIKNAKRFIHIQYYIIRNDELGRKIISALVEKAKQGVEVKFLYDGMGNLYNPRCLTKPILDAGGDIGIFLPPQFVRINFRNHRKITVIDGEVGYIGGFNVGDEYVGNVSRFGFWRDTHIRIVGDAVKELEVRFICDWNFVSKNKIEIGDFYFPDMTDRQNGVDIQIVSSGPDCKWNNIHYGYQKMMSEANERIYVQTPYFVPDDSIFETLKIAALSGIDVRIMFPANPDHIFVYWANLSYIGELLEAGVKCYKYEKGFIHSKLVAIDSLMCSIGTANMDVRSFKLNFEVNAFIYDHNTTKAFEDQFIKDTCDCTLITKEWYDKRSRRTKIKEALVRLISPLL